jgi:hypothetical protein
LDFTVCGRPRRESQAAKEAIVASYADAANWRKTTRKSWEILQEG